MNLVKDSLYCDAPKSVRRLQIQSVLFYVLKNSLIFLAPILVHTADEAYGYLQFGAKKQSVHLEEQTSIDQLLRFDTNGVDWDGFFAFKNELYEYLEVARNRKVIKQTNEALVNLSQAPNIKGLNQTQLIYLLQIGELVINPAQSQRIFVQKSNALTCARCRLVVDRINSDGLSERCAEAIKIYNSSSNR